MRNFIPVDLDNATLARHLANGRRLQSEAIRQAIGTLFAGLRRLLWAPVPRRTTRVCT